MLAVPLVPAVAVSHGRAAFESDAVVARGAQMVPGIKVGELACCQSSDAVSIHLYEILAVGMPAFYARTGDIMCIGREAYPVEILLASDYHSVVIDIHVTGKDPGPNRIRSNAEAGIGERSAEGAEDAGHLYV